ncbi:hypothetical protein D1822_10990 [Phaeobacter inhibens]|uniref:hypothetical protein n=1 Tax=Phaeobacter inhibens TaxID=221822 RepID=UPI000163319F|nr:hypothetical protein [Phaeobacter inhibens]AFO91942.1 hypothetical protein PGA1_c22560 [Phaeobacter inhibens DSM 17395]AUQ46617.1 hypothetical protein PhaeoP10_02287 [Phaeobacter inhibens]AXT23305.1 hypothetical protein D1822_10990 [Phaeobacter inhibens]
MTIQTQHEFEAKAKELQAAINSVNLVIHSLQLMGAKVEIDWCHPRLNTRPKLIAAVYRRVSPTDWRMDDKGQRGT